jgi:hypothetical protein
MTASAESRAAGRASRQQRVPDFFIVGHAKCGTTALYAMLRHHPQLFMPALKEPRFLSDDLRDRFQPPGAPVLPSTLDEYLSLFAPAKPEQLVGEASPTYLRSRTAAARIADMQPSARIIAILREPASFLRSLHLQFVEAHNETETDLGKAIALERVRREGKRIPHQSHRPQGLLYSEHIRYVEQLRRYHAVFAPEQVMVLIYDDFRRDNEATVRQVLRFLGVDDTLPIAATEANPTVRVRGTRLHTLTHAASMANDPVSRTVKTALKALAPKALGRESLITIRNRLLYTSPRPPDESVMLELRRRFKPEVVALSEYLGRDLVTLWGYGDLD